MKEKLFEKIESLGFDKNDFIILGSGIMQAKEIRCIGDLDILVKEELFDKLKASGGWEYKREEFSGVERDVLLRGDVEIHNDFWIDKSDSEVRKDFNHFIKDGKTELIHGINFISLKYLLFIKSLWGRQKDLNDVRLIEEYLKNPKD